MKIYNFVESQFKAKTNPIEPNFILVKRSKDGTNPKQTQTYTVWAI